MSIGRGVDRYRRSFVGQPRRLNRRLILEWADAHRRRTGDWPTTYAGPIVGARGETWKKVDVALRCGFRGLRGRCSLLGLLMKRRGVRNTAKLPRLLKQQILAWADEHHERTKTWPGAFSGVVHAAPDETWRAIDEALRKGMRGLPRGSSLATFLDSRRRARNPSQLQRLTLKRILEWADAYHQRRRRWPIWRSGRIAGTPNETWESVDRALRKGIRGLKWGSSLARLLAERRGVRNIMALARLTEQQVLLWADAYFSRTGQWPTRYSGPVAGVSGESWHALEVALQLGNRGLPGGSSLKQLLRRAGRCRAHSDRGVGRCNFPRPASLAMLEDG